MRCLIATATLAISSLASPVDAKLPPMLEKPWIGFFVGWEGKDQLFGVTRDGKAVIRMTERKEIDVFNTFIASPVVREEIDGRWVNRRWNEEALSSEFEGGVDPSDPISLTYTFTGDTKVKLIYTFSDDTVAVKLQEVSKTTTNPIQLGLKIDLPDIYKYAKTEGLRDRDLRRKFRSDRLEAVRKSDGEKFKVGLYEEVDLKSEEYLAEGATEVEVEADKFSTGDFFMALGNKDLGKIDFEGGASLMDRITFLWWPDPAELENPQSFLTFGLK